MMRLHFAGTRQAIDNGFSKLLKCCSRMFLASSEPIGKWMITRQQKAND